MAKAKVKKVAKAKKPVKAKKVAKKAPKKQAKLVKAVKAKSPKPVKQQPAKPMKKEAKAPEIQEKALGEVSNYFEHVQAAAIRLEAPLKVGDTVHIKGGEVDFEQKVDSMQINREPITEAKIGDEVGIRVSQHVRKGYKVYKK